MNTAHGYAFFCGGGFKLVTNLKETKEAKCNYSDLVYLHWVYSTGRSILHDFK